MSWFPGFKLRLINKHAQSCVIFNIFSVLLLLRQETQSVTKKFDWSYPAKWDHSKYSYFASSYTCFNDEPICRYY